MFCCLNDSGEIRKEIDCISVNHSILNLPENWTNEWKTKQPCNKEKSNEKNNDKVGHVVIALPKHMTMVMSKEEIEQGKFIGELNEKKYHHSLKNLKPFKIKNYHDDSTPHYLDVRELLLGVNTPCISNHKATILKNELIHDNYELLASPLTTHESTFDEIYDINSKFEMIIDKKEINETVSSEKHLQEDVSYIATPNKASLSIEIEETNPIDLKELFSKTSPTFLPFAYKGEFYENLHKRF